jgi:hypothetical protein
MNEALSRMQVFITDGSLEPVSDAELNVTGTGDINIGRDEETGAFTVTGAVSGTTLQLHAVGADKQPLVLDVEVRSGDQQVVLGLPADGELTYRRGDSRLAFRPDRDHHLVYVNGKGAASITDTVMKELGLRTERLSPPRTDRKGRGADTRGVADSDADETTHLVTSGPDDVSRAAQTLRSRRLDVRLARPISHRDGQQPYGLTNEIVASFQGDVAPDEAARIAAEHGLRIERKVHHAGNGFLLSRKGEPDYDILETASALANDPRVLWAEPNLVVMLENDQYTPNDFLYGQLPHLRVINADDAWDRLDNVAVALRGGSPAICIGVVDTTGVAPNHPDLTANLTNGTSKLQTSINFVPNPIVAQTVAGLGGDHGTQCAGSATGAFDNSRGIAGVAPNCRLLGARPRNATDEVRLADVYMWMAGFANGSTDPGFPALPAQPAHVISSSFGVTGAALSTTIRTLFDHLTTFGRAGRGVVLCWSLGNSGYGDFTNPTGGRFRAWPTYEKCIAVGSSLNTSPTNPTTSVHADPTGITTGIATQVDRRALYSPFGPTALRKPDLVSPSHTSYSTAAGNPLVDPIMSSVRVGVGAVDGCAGTATCNDYDTTFGGTSHSTPTVAGAVALILSARSDLSWVAVRDVLRRTCARIDAANLDAIGQWQDLDGDGAVEYSRWYGAGRLDVDAAVAAVLDPALTLPDVYVRENLADIGDVPSPGWHAHSPDVWVRPTDDPIPALAWTDPAPHANPVRNQPNFVYGRLRNRGTAAAPVVYVRASITHFPGFEFRYPQEFQPTTNVGAAIPNPITAFGTYLIGEVRVNDLAAGADTIIKMTWPTQLIPPKQVQVGTLMVDWHPCLLLEVSPHDGPAVAPGVIAVRGDNNIAQRNLHIADVDSDAWAGIVIGSFDKVGIRSLVIDTRQIEGECEVILHIADEEAGALLRRGLESAFMVRPDDCSERRPKQPISVLLHERTRLLIRGTEGEPTLEVLAAPGTELRLADNARLMTGTGGQVDAPKVYSDTADGVVAAVIAELSGVLEIPLPLGAARFAPLAVKTRGDWRGELRITQRRGDTLLSTGYTIQR